MRIEISPPEIVALTKLYLRENLTGGSLHIVLDDGNTEDDHVKWCEEHAIKEGDPAGAFLARALLLLPEDERWIS